MSLVRVTGASLPPLQALTLELDQGLHTVLGTPTDGTAALIELIAGTVAPRSGEVRIAGLDPYRSPALRRQLGIVLAGERIPPARRLSQSLELCLGHDWARRTLRQLEDLVLSAWAERPVRSLSGGELRTIALAAALSAAPLTALCVHEPLALPASRETILGRLRALAEAGALVLCTSSSVRDALELGGHLSILHQGRLLRRENPLSEMDLTPGARPVMRVQTADPRRLGAGLLAREDDRVIGVEWREGTPSDLVVTGRDRDGLALAIMEVVVEHHIPIAAMEPVFPSLQVVQAASLGAARAAFDNAYRSTTSTSAFVPVPASATPATPGEGPSGVHS